MSDKDRHRDAQRRAEAAIVNKYNIKFLGFEIDGPVFRVGAKQYPINMISAEVIQGSPTSSSRITLTRVVGGGLVAGVGGALLVGAAKKSTDTTNIYVSVATPDGEIITRTTPASNERIARMFADKLQCAATRAWPLQTAFGELPLDPSSQRVGGLDPSVTLWPLAIAAMSIALAFMHPAFIAGVLVAFIAWIALTVVESGKDAAALDEVAPGWREREAEAQKRAEEEMWRAARDKS